MSRLVAAFVLATLTLHPGLRAAQSANIAGNWAVEAAETETNDGAGNMTRLVALSGLLTLEQKGDAVTGSWKGRLPRPWTLTGRVDGKTFELQTETRDMPIESNGERQMVPRHWIFTGTIDGNRLTGSMALAGGDGAPPMQPFTAQRKD
jgi:hypothetical protein